VPVPATPIRITAADGSQSETSTIGPPIVGEDTEDVLRNAGFLPEEIDGLVMDGIV
jgi:crotonobetainyl-CoA:carnitine CoA-transferase CaiB-like acyl-CoA transferase